MRSSFVSIALATISLAVASCASANQHTNSPPPSLPAELTSVPSSLESRISFTSAAREGSTFNSEGTNSIDHFGFVTPFDEVIRSSQLFLIGTNESVGPSILDTRSGALELSEGVATTGYEPLTPISIMVERTIAARPTSSFSVKAGDHFAVTKRGGEMTLSIRRDFAATHWKSLLVTDSPVPAVPPEYIEIKISQKTFVSLKVGDRVAVGITQQQTPFVAPGADTVYLSRVVGPAY